MSDIDEKILESELRGKTLRVYWHFVRYGGKAIGVREVQRALGFSSPSVASHHLEKLSRLGLLEKKITGEYVLAEDVKVGVLKQFIRLGSLMLPRYLFYAVLFTTMLLAYIALYAQTLSVHNIVALIFGLLSCSFLWYETYRIFKQAPS